MSVTDKKVTDTSGLSDKDRSPSGSCTSGTEALLSWKNLKYHPLLGGVEAVKWLGHSDSEGLRCPALVDFICETSSVNFSFPTFAPQSECSAGASMEVEQMETINTRGGLVHLRPQKFRIARF